MYNIYYIINNYMINIFNILLEFFKTEEGLVLSCFTSLMVTQPKNTIINHPAKTVFGGLIGGLIISKIIRYITTEKLRPYVSVGLFIMSIPGVLYKLFDRYDPYDPHKPYDPYNKMRSNNKNGITYLFDLPFINIYYQTSPHDKSNDIKKIEYTYTARISYTAHAKLTSASTIKYNIIDILSVDTIMKVLTDNHDKINFTVTNSHKLIHDVLDDVVTLKHMRGVFIHDSTEGYIMITTDDATIKSNIIVSINIDDLNNLPKNIL